MADIAGTPASGFDGFRLRHWKPERRDDGVLVLYFDRADAPVNAFSQDVLIELADALERIAIDPPKAVVIASAKASGFIAGADLKEFQEFDRKGTVDDAIRRGQQVLQKLAELPCPTAPRSTASAWAAVPRSRWPAATAWPVTIRPPASACRRRNWASSRAGAAAPACRAWSVHPRRWT